MNLIKIDVRNNSKKIKIICGSIILLILSILFFFVAAEICCLFILPPTLPEKLPLCRIRAHPQLGYEMVPNHTHYTYIYPVYINSLGLRNREISEKRKNTYRILCLGDSHTYGQGVATKDLFTTILEKKLNKLKRGREYEIINSGVRGYSINQEVAFLKEKGLGLSPDIVIIFFFINDIFQEDINKIYSRSLSRSSGKKEYYFDLKKVNWTKWKIYQILRKSRFGMFLWDKIKILRYKNVINCETKLLLGDLDEGLKKEILNSEDVIREFAQLMKQYIFEGIIAIIPPIIQIKEDFYNEKYQSIVKQWGKKYNIKTIDLLPGFKKYYKKYKKVPIVPYDGHYNSTGHRIIAEETFEFLKNNFLKIKEVRG